MIQPKDEVFRYYFYFVQERMNIFWRKCDTSNKLLTTDPILRDNKFTNVYRACDRVSQYLIKNVIYEHQKGLNEKDILLRILVFKIFNKIDTWEYLEKNLGVISVSNFKLKEINALLGKRIVDTPIFSNAYMMTGTHSKYNHLQYKHEKWLQMVKTELLDAGVFDKIIKAKSMEKVYNTLRSISFIGDFLAYQYTIDMNYSPVLDFSEDSFVKAGIGAIRGIKKCFEPLGKNTLEDAIRYTQQNFEHLQNRYGFTEFKNLFGRQPTLIDIQNCFCETDKYLRAKMPELMIDNKRIKQKYKPTKKSIELFFPPKWGLNDKIENRCIQKNTEGLIPF
jgi:hypothetical protein